MFICNLSLVGYTFHQKIVMGPQPLDIEKIFSCCIWMNHKDYRDSWRSDMSVNIPGQAVVRKQSCITGGLGM